MTEETKKAEFKKVYYLIPLFIFFLTGETATRIYYYLNPKPPLKAPYDNAMKDELLGWKMTPNYTFEGIMKDVKLTPYPVQLRYNKNGFKAFGNIQTKRPKILFIGDSYTSSIEVSNENSYFQLIGDSLDVEVFAYGQAGYGTLQEYLIYDQFIDQIQPDIVVWQVCNNDFIDNLCELEMNSGYRVFQRRPYLKMDGTMVYQHPRPTSEKIMPYSNFLGFLLAKREHWIRQNRPFAEAAIAKHYETPFEPFVKSIAITEQIVHKIRKRTPTDVKIAAFSSGSLPPYITEFKRIFEYENIPVWMEPVKVLRKARADGLAVHSRDQYHWNNLGHRMVADELITQLKPILQN